MSTPVIVWIAIIGIFAAAIVIRFSVEMVKHFHKSHSHSIFSTGTEREEFFVPGDPVLDEELLYDED